MNDLAHWAKAHNFLSLKGTPLLNNAYWYVVASSGPSLPMDEKFRNTLGFGVDASKEVAATKATAEWVERQTARHWGVGTNGMAAHSNVQQAQTNAVFKLIERDAFFCHWLCKVPGNSIHKNQWEHFQESILSMGTMLSFCSLTAPLGISVVFCQAAFCDGAISCGLGTSKSVEQAMTKAFLEVLPTIVKKHIGAAQKKENSTSKMLDQAEAYSLPVNTTYTALDHHHAYLEPGKINATCFFFESNRNLLPQAIHSNLDLQVAELDKPKFLESCPLVVCHARSPKVQAQFLGFPAPSILNHVRLKEFNNGVEPNLNLNLHPLG